MYFNNSSGAQARTVSAEYDQGLRAYMLKVYNYMAASLVITGAVSFGVSTSNDLLMALFGTPLKWVVLFAPLGVLIYMSYSLRKMSSGAARNLLFVFATLMGVSMSYIFVAYTGSSVARTFFITAASFGALSLYGYTTKKDLTGFGSFLIMGVFGLLLASLVNLFLASSGLQFAISALGVLIFAGLTAYDTQRIKQTYFAFGADDKMAVMGAVSLYIDFINLFQFLLHFMGQQR